MLQHEFTTATLSRGYKRKTKGYGLANENTTALEIGDEPMQFHRKFPQIAVAVGEERLEAIPHLLQDRADTEVIILDDAFQHRAVKAGFNILLTDYGDLYTRDFLLPAGNLRDSRQSAARADVIIVTKCKPGITGAERQELIRELQPLPQQEVYFTEIVYGQPYHLFSRQEMTLQPQSDVLLVCGIANPRPLKEMLTARVHSYEMLRYPDHHIFDLDDLKAIKQQFEQLETADKMILTTEKDGVRLLKFESELSGYPLAVLPIRHAFLFGEADKFRDRVLSFVREKRVRDAG
jgi:tetraacyldisaccharide 4'-kinase